MALPYEAIRKAEEVVVQFTAVRDAAQQRVDDGEDGTYPWMQDREAVRCWESAISIVKREFELR